MREQVGEYAARAGPGVAVTGLHLFGLPIADVVQLAVLIYTVLQISWFVYSKWFKNVSK